VCCSTLQCVAVRCSAFQRVAACRSELQRVAVCHICVIAWIVIWGSAPSRSSLLMNTMRGTPYLLACFFWFKYIQISMYIHIGIGRLASAVREWTRCVALHTYQPVMLWYIHRSMYIHIGIGRLAFQFVDEHDAWHSIPTSLFVLVHIHIDINVCTHWNWPPRISVRGWTRCVALHTY